VTAAAGARRPVLLAAVLLSAVVGLIGGAGGAWALYQRLGPAREVVSSPNQGGAAGSGALTFDTLAARVSPSVVKIVTRAQTPSDLLGTPHGFAVGFVAGNGGLVVTSAHAVSGATRLQLALTDGRLVDASIAETDLVHGVVVLQAAESRSLTPLGFANFDRNAPVPGDVAIAVGSPPLATVSVTSGTVRTAGRHLTLGDGAGAATVDDALTVDATVDPADDGAPLLDGAGDVIGVVTVPGSGSPGLVGLSGRAAAALVDRAAKGIAAPTAGFGVEAGILDAATGAAYHLPAGALIRAVTPGGAGEQAGLRAGDVVTAVGGTAVDASHPLDAAILGLASGQQVALSVFRDGAERTVTLTVG